MRRWAVQGFGETLSNGLDIQTSNVGQNQRGNTEKAKWMFSDFIGGLVSRFLVLFFPSHFGNIHFRVNKDAEENCVYLQIIPKTEHTSTLHFAAEILPSMQIRVAHMPERRGEPSWYDCFRKLTHQEKEKKKGTFRKAVAYIHRFLTLISDRFYSKQALSSKNDDPAWTLFHSIIV